MKIAAVIVTYNRKELLSKNINKLLSQSYPLDSIIIVDNCSTDGTKEFILNEYIDEKIDYLLLDKNIGGAGGFYTGSKRAFDMGFDFAWLMDDDGRPKNADTLDNIVKKVEKIDNKLIILNSVVLSNENDLSFGMKAGQTYDVIKTKADQFGLIIDDISPFNGTFISKKLFETIGFPNKDFFIKGDETDFTRRARNAGCFIATVVDSLYYHPSVKCEKKIKFLWKSLVNDLEAPWKEYYKARNYTYMSLKGISFFFFKRKIKSLISHDEFSKARIKMINRGIKDGKKGNLGIVVEPGDNDWRKKR